MFVIQLPFHPWQGGQQMPAKWLWPICVSGEFDKIVWSIIRGIQTKKLMNSLDNGAILVLITLHCELVISGSWGHMLSFESFGSWINYDTIKHLKLENNTEDSNIGINLEIKRDAAVVSQKKLSNKGRQHYVNGFP